MRGVVRFFMLWKRQRRKQQQKLNQLFGSIKNHFVFIFYFLFCFASGRSLLTWEGDPFGLLTAEQGLLVLYSILLLSVPSAIRVRECVWHDFGWHPSTQAPKSLSTQAAKCALALPVPFRQARHAPARAACNRQRLGPTYIAT